MARRKVETGNPASYADTEPSAFASMLGGLVKANIAVPRIGIYVTRIFYLQ